MVKLDVTREEIIAYIAARYANFQQEKASVDGQREGKELLARSPMRGNQGKRNIRLSVGAAGWKDK